MTLADLLVWAGIVVLGIWGARRVFGSVGRDRDWPERVNRFVEAHGLREKVPEPQPDSIAAGQSVLALIRRSFSGNPALHRSAAGTAVYCGELDGLPFVFDQVIFKSRRGVICIYVRMAVTVAEMPGSLVVSPAGRLRQLLRSEEFVVQYSKRPAEKAREEAFLNRERLRTLAAFKSECGDVYLASGRLYLISDRHGRGEVDLNRMRAELSRMVSAMSLHSARRGFLAQNS